jgi:hypothetical protein
MILMVHPFTLPLPLPLPRRSRTKQPQQQQQQRACLLGPKQRRIIQHTILEPAFNLGTSCKTCRAPYLNSLPEGAKFFSVNAVGMYSNSIDTDHDIEVLTHWLTNYWQELPRSMPVDLILASLAEIMQNNIFQFGDTYWCQKCRCAIGTSLGVNYACLYIGLLGV